MAPLPVLITPMQPTQMIPMPVFYGNPTLSWYAIMLFPDDRDLARKLVARLLNYGTVQSVLAAGIQLDNRYLAEILTDLRDGQPDQRRVAKRLKWASACGQIVKVVFALTNSPDPRVREYASWEQAIKQAEQEWGRGSPKRGEIFQLSRPAPPVSAGSAFLRRVRNGRRGIAASPHYRGVDVRRDEAIRHAARLAREAHLPWAAQRLPYRRYILALEGLWV
jgi:hypothetical protein